MSLADYNTSYILTVLCMLIVDNLMIRRLSKGNYLGNRQRWVNIMLIVSGICAFSDIMCILISGVKYKFPVFFFNAVFDLAFTMVAFFLFYRMEKEIDSKLFNKKWFKHIVFIPVVLTLIFLVLSYPFGLIFSVDSLGNYTRGPLYSFFYFVLANGYTIFTFISYPFRYLGTSDDRKKRILYNTIIYYLPVVIGSIIQMHNYYFPGCNIGLTTSVLFVLIRGLEEEVEIKTNSLELKNFELKEALDEANINRDVIMAIGKMYIAIYDINLDEGTYAAVHGISNVYRDFGDEGKNLDAISRIMNEIVSDDYKDVMAEFYDLHTLKDRLKDINTVHADYKASDGRWVSARFVVKTRNSDGSAHEVLYIPRVITSEKIKELEYQEEIVKSNLEAKKANLVKTDFLRRMSHDIRTPINGIRGLVKIAQDNEDNKEKIDDCLNKIYESSGFLLSLVNDVLDMNKLESGEITLDHNPFKLDKIINNAIDITKVRANERDITITSDIKIEYNDLVGSPLHLAQIFQNIINNAVKYNHKNGSINIALTEELCPGNKVLVKLICADTGIGMSEDFQENVFKPFAQEGNTARGTYEGTGLGMAITKELVDKMGGSIGFSSVLNKGTTFVVELPFDLGESVTKEVEEENYDVSGLKVLVVEDNEINREIATFMLEKAGIAPTCATNGKEGLEKAKEGTYDCILMDVMMPVMGGLEATRQLRAMGVDIPIIAMSANAFKDDVERSLNAGMNAHLSKPIDEKLLVKTIYKFCKK